jgi:hypothetical protein
LRKKLNKAKENHKFAMARKKPDVVNRKVKGEDRNLVRAREKAAGMFRPSQFPIKQDSADFSTNPWGFNTVRKLVVGDL